MAGTMALKPSGMQPIISGIAYLVAGVLGVVGAPVIIALPVGAALVLGFLFAMKAKQAKA